MSEKDVIMQKISFYKMIFLAVLAIVVSIIGYMVQNRDESPIVLAISSGLVIFLLYVIMEIIQLIYNNIKKLKDF